MEASRYVSTLDAMIDREIGLNCAKSSNSNSRNLVRVKRSIDMLKVIFEQILAKRYVNKFLSIAYLRFGFRKVLKKEKNTKKNGFIIFGFNMKNIKENQI